MVHQFQKYIGPDYFHKNKDVVSGIVLVNEKVDGLDLNGQWKANFRKQNHPYVSSYNLLSLQGFSIHSTFFFLTEFYPQYLTCSFQFIFGAICVTYFQIYVYVFYSAYNQI